MITTTALVILYYLSPLDRLASVPLGVSLAIALLILLIVAIVGIRATMRATYPGVRGVEALATTVPLFMLLYAATYFLMARTDPGSFSADGLTRTDTLYFTITIFSTVGFGDITATSQSARILASTQMILDLLILGLGLQAFIGAIRLGRQRPPSISDAESVDRP